MYRFRQFLHEASDRQVDRLDRVDPVKLGQRISSRFGIGPEVDYREVNFSNPLGHIVREVDYGDFHGAKKHYHIPLRQYDEDKSEEVTNRQFDLRNKLGVNGYWSSTKPRTIKIRDLVPTQPFVRTDDENLLRSKVEDRNPNNIHVGTYGGRHYVLDGHHSILGAILRGDKSVNVRHIDLDQDI